MDEDGSVYLYSGFCPVDFPWKMVGTEPRKRVVKGGMVIELEGHEFFEAPSIRKVKDTHYLVYSSFYRHELCYSTSKSPVDGFKYDGTIVFNGDIYVTELIKIISKFLVKRIQKIY